MLGSVRLVTSRHLIYDKIFTSHYKHTLSAFSVMMSSGSKKLRVDEETPDHSSSTSRHTDGIRQYFSSRSSSKESSVTWQEEKSRFLKMDLAEKRTYYLCGGRFVEYNEQNFSDLPRPGGENTARSKVAVWQGDITLLEFDAIVNAANEELRGGAGVDGAIHRAAGHLLKMETRDRYPQGCETGDSKITGGYKLPAKHVIHTVGPMYKSREKLQQCYESTLSLVEKNDIRTIAFPCISTGIYGYPNKDAAKVALITVRDWLNVHPDFNGKIVFCVYMDLDLHIYERLIDRIFSTETPDSVESDDKGGPGHDKDYVLSSQAKQTETRTGHHTESSCKSPDKPRSKGDPKDGGKRKKH